MKRFIAILGLLAAGTATADPIPNVTKSRANYILHCSGCHGMSGLGTVAGGIPAFPGSVGHIARLENGRSYLLQVPGVITTSMGDAEIAGVLNYILQEWSDDAVAPFSAHEIAQRRALPPRDVVDYRREITHELRAKGIEIAQYPWP